MTDLASHTDISNHTLEYRAYLKLKETLEQMKRHSSAGIQGTAAEQAKNLIKSGKGFSVEIKGPDGKGEPVVKDEIIYSDEQVGDIWGMMVYFSLETTGQYGLSDWILAGTKKITRTEGDDEDLVEVEQYSTDIRIPEEQWHSADAHCDHCHHISNRNRLYLLRNRETGEWRQVGRTCLKEYGFSKDNAVEDIVRYHRMRTNLSIYIDAEAACLGDDLSEAVRNGGARLAEYATVPLRKFIAICGAVIKQTGYKSEREWSDCWKSTEFGAFGPYGWWEAKGFSENESPDEDEQKLSTLLAAQTRFGNGYEPSADELIYADKVIDFMREYETDDKNFQEKLRHLAERKNIPVNRVRMACFWPATYEKEQLRMEADREFAEFSSQFAEGFLGDEKERFKALPVVFVKVAQIDCGHFGLSYWGMFKTKDNRCIVWKTGRNFADFLPGEEYLMDATIKEHLYRVPQSWRLPEPAKEAWRDDCRKFHATEVTRAKLSKTS